MQRSPGGFGTSPRRRAAAPTVPRQHIESPQSTQIDDFFSEKKPPAGTPRLQRQCGVVWEGFERAPTAPRRRIESPQTSQIDARAIVRDSKLLILDEATSAIDYKTDTVIQASLRNELKPDVTVITVAHRLQTILDSDKIMVLDDGRIVEFDAPKVLLQNAKGKLRALVDESGDKSNLFAMAEG
ncbi:P-loop containing nucleoside triphosphate hydrolase protein [Mycena belliarum]|uniref:P-loop containing nucleoside triphosphate hydrolase protein n=1 Tax=Mycena belliarum TaxID=1033014 RepID=A0AAD6TNG0_9AGAR|nr:P-loop containing nucleoside triphosphate hydrolase protein [Mycena belliae]